MKVSFVKLLFIRVAYGMLPHNTYYVKDYTIINYQKGK